MNKQPPKNPPVIYIGCIDKEGNRKNLPVKAWAEITGKNEKTIRNHYHKKKAGYKISNRQVVGIDEANCRAMNKSQRSKTRAVVSGSILSKFLRTRLVEAA